jgi:hypothetical protein
MMVEFIPEGTTLTKVHSGVQNKGHGMLPSDVPLLHADACTRPTGAFQLGALCPPYIAVQTNVQKHIETFIQCFLT